MKWSSFVFVLLVLCTLTSARAEDLYDTGHYLTYRSRLRHNITVVRIGAETWAAIQVYLQGHGPLPASNPDIEVFTGTDRVFTPQPFFEPQISRSSRGPGAGLSLKLVDGQLLLEIDLSAPYDAKMQAVTGGARESLKLSFYSEAFKVDLRTLVVPRSEAGSVPCQDFLRAEPTGPTGWRLLRWAR